MFKKKGDEAHLSNHYHSLKWHSIKKSGISVCEIFCLSIKYKKTSLDVSVNLNKAKHVQKLQLHIMGIYQPLEQTHR